MCFVDSCVLLLFTQKYDFGSVIVLLCVTDAWSCYAKVNVLFALLTDA